MTLTTINLILKFDFDFSTDNLIELSNKYLRVKTIIVYNSPYDKSVYDSEKTLTDIFYTKEDFSSEKCCGKVSPSLFTTNMKLFTESQEYNSCLNKKIAIDINGNIKNTTLKAALHHKDFKKHWSITKDHVDVCKDCEFRYICTDCRAYLENPGDPCSKPLKCGYDPYTNVWQDWSTNPLKQQAIDFYGMRDLVKRP